MSAVDLFNSIFNPLCTAMADAFHQLTLALGANIDYATICTSIGDIFRSLLANIPF